MNNQTNFTREEIIKRYNIDNNKIKKIELMNLVNFSIQINVLLKLKNLNI